MATCRSATSGITGSAGRRRAAFTVRCCRTCSRISCSFAPTIRSSTSPRRYAAGLPLPRDDYRLTRTRDRSSRIHFDQMDVERIRARNVANFARLYEGTQLPSPDQFVADLAELPRWVRRIESRGGRVVFFREPVAGRASRARRVEPAARTLLEPRRRNVRAHDARLPGQPAIRRLHAPRQLAHFRRPGSRADRRAGRRIARAGLLERNAFATMKKARCGSRSGLLWTVKGPRRCRPALTLNRGSRWSPSRNRQALPLGNAHRFTDGLEATSPDRHWFRECWGRSRTPQGIDRDCVARAPSRRAFPVRPAPCRSRPASP